VKGRKSRREEDPPRPLRQSQSCDGISVSAGGPKAKEEVKVSLGEFLAEAGLEAGGGGEDSSSLTSWTSHIKQRSRLSKSVKVRYGTT